MSKQALRDAADAARRSLTDDQRRRASAEAVTRLAGLPELSGARTVLLYAATDTELDPTGLTDALGRRDVRTLYPRVRGEDLELVAAASRSRLSLGYRGILEPTGPAVDPAVVDVALVPGSAFDPHGRRLGRGGGHYDRLLGRLADTATTVGLCFSCQMVPAVPTEAHDVPVDVVVTERAVYRRPGAGGPPQGA